MLLGTLLSILGGVFTNQTVYFLFVAVFPNKYVASHGQWGDGMGKHNPWAWSHFMFVTVTLVMVLGSYVVISFATTAKMRVTQKEHAGTAAHAALDGPVSLKSIDVDSVDVEATLREVELKAEDLLALENPLLVNELLKDAGVGSAALRLRILLHIKPAALPAKATPASSFSFAMAQEGC